MFNELAWQRAVDRQAQLRREARSRALSRRIARVSDDQSPAVVLGGQALWTRNTG